MSTPDSDDLVAAASGAVHAFSYASDDYEEITEQYFGEMLRSRTWRVLPAGWHNPKSTAADAFNRVPSLANDAVQYALDEGRALGELKSSILTILSAWEARILDWNEVTVCPSVSTANLVVMGALKARGIKSIIFEAPAYYATIDQAELLGLSFERIGSFRSENFEAPAERFAAAIPETPCAVWLTQPRFGMGTDQDLNRVHAIAGALRPDDVLVFDEAAEQHFPSLMSQLPRFACDVVRTRGLVKGIGLNGLRAAVIIHPAAWRDRIERTLEAAGSSLDRHSLRNFSSFASMPQLLPSLLTVANQQVVQLRKRVDTITTGSWVTPTPLINGYIGSLLLDLTGLAGPYEAIRDALLRYCKRVLMPVVLRSSIGFPHDPSWEAVRINYFTPDQNVEVTAELLVEGFEDLAAELGRSGSAGL